MAISIPALIFVVVAIVALVCFICHMDHLAREQKRAEEELMVNLLIMMNDLNRKDGDSNDGGNTNSKNDD